jgi:hypothetical protein
VDYSRYLQPCSARLDNSGPLSGPRSVNGNRKLIRYRQLKIDQLGFIGRRPWWWGRGRGLGL